MIRELTLGERECIADALIRQVEALDLRAESILSRKRELDLNADDNTTDVEDKLDKAAIKRARELSRVANATHNLARFILRNNVIVRCDLTIPEQF